MWEAVIAGNLLVYVLGYILFTIFEPVKQPIIEIKPIS